MKEMDRFALIDAMAPTNTQNNQPSCFLNGCLIEYLKRPSGNGLKLETVK